MAHESKRIGDLNGWWARLFKLVQILVAVAIPVSIFVLGAVVFPWCKQIDESVHLMTTQLTVLESYVATIRVLDDRQRLIQERVLKLESFAGEGDRFTARDANTMKLQLQNDWLRELSLLKDQITKLPSTIQVPPVWFEQYVRTEFARQEQRLNKLEGKERLTP